MCTDASALGIGAVFMQAEESKWLHVLACASRILVAAESKYSVIHLESFSVVWALKHFRDIIFGYPITVYTDYITVTQFFHNKNLTGRLARCILLVLSNNLNQHSVSAWQSQRRCSCLIPQHSSCCSQ